ncbi:MAG TPA: tetratricopeptide repeat protein [Gemmatimonadales bacterium]|jgi:tetratricopeptide (TPR) repeat protein
MLTALFLGAVSAALVMARSLGSAEASATPRLPETRVLQMDIGFFQARVARDPRSARDFAELARLFLQRGRLGGGDGDFRRAEGHARHSLELRRGRNGTAFQVLAASLMGQHRFPEARSVAEGLLALDSTSTSARSLLGEIQLELGAYDQARRTFGMLYTVRDDLTVAARYARWEELRGRPEAARRLLREARDRASRLHGMSPSHIAWFQWRLGDLALRYGRLGEAERELQAGLAGMPDDHRLLEARARVAAARGRWGEAIEYGERALARSLDPATLGFLYQAYAASGDSLKAEEYYRALSVSVLEQDTFHRLWGLLLLDRGKEVPSVLARAEREIAVRQDIYGWDLLAWALYRSGRAAEAHERMRRALALGTRDPTLYFHAGTIEAALGYRADSRRHLRAALAINPHWDPFQPAEARATLARLDATEE